MKGAARRIIPSLCSLLNLPVIEMIRNPDQLIGQGGERGHKLLLSVRLRGLVHTVFRSLWYGKLLFTFTVHRESLLDQQAHNGA